MARRVHINRTLDMLLGAILRAKGPKSIQEVEAVFNKVLKDVEAADFNYRDILTAYTPAIYVVDCKDIATTFKRELSKNSVNITYGNINAEMGGIERLSEFFNSTSDTLVGTNNGLDLIDSITSDPNFENELAPYLHSAFINGTTAIKKSTINKSIAGGLGIERLTVFEKGPSVKPLATSTLDSLFNSVKGSYISYRAKVAEVMRSPNIRNYQKIEAYGVDLGNKVSKILKDTKVFIASDANKYIAYKSDNGSLTHVVCGNNFDGVVTAVNRILDAAFKQFLYSKNSEILHYIRERDPSKPKDKFFGVGFIINAGHTAVSNITAAGRTLRGVNMPSAQQAQLSLSKVEAAELETKLSKLYADIGYDISFKNSYTVTNVLLELNFAFVVTMPTALNTKGLNVAEQAIIRSYKTGIEKSLKEKIAGKQFKDIIKEYGIISTASPALVDNITNAILNILKGEKVVPTLSSKMLKGMSRSNLNNTLNKVAKAKSKGTQKPKALSVSLSTKNLNNSRAVKATYSLASLQALLDAQLQHVVAANMGNGNSRNTLNYRTGRLAESAKVERLSQSREGMITAFYSYMRNPYGTFSDGGRQQYPKSRDPKLLISTSIKEIAATKVANRLRAVLV